MDQNLKMQQVIKVLKEKGSTNEQITQFLEELSKAAFAKFYTQAMAVLTDEDLAAIEACPDQESANLKINELYSLRTGKDAKIETQKFLDDFAQGFLNQYQNERSS